MHVGPHGWGSCEPEIHGDPSTATRCQRGLRLIPQRATALQLDGAIKAHHSAEAMLPLTIMRHELRNRPFVSLPRARSEVAHA